RLFLAFVHFRLDHLSAMGCAGTATARATTISGTQDGQHGRRRRNGGPGADVDLLLSNALGRLSQGRVVNAAVAARAIAMLRHFIAERIGAQVGNLAQEIDRRFRVSRFEFAVRGAHAAKRLNAALVATRDTRFLLAARAQQWAVPALIERSIAPVVMLLLGNHANRNLAGGVNRAAVHSSAAEVHVLVVVVRATGQGAIMFGEAAKIG